MTDTITARTSPPLIFVYRGGEIPDYAWATIRFAASGYEGDVVLLADAPPHWGKLPKGVQFESINSEWYDRSMFADFVLRSPLNRTFRQGFWLHAVERFFILAEYMEHRSIERFFHAELDVLVLDLNGVAAACDAVGQGLFAVMDDRKRALASIFYVNAFEGLVRFLKFSVEHAQLGNEMNLLGAFLQEHPDFGFALPSERYFDPVSHPLSPSRVPDMLGLFDAAALGQWLFGIDPRNVRYFSYNRYRNPHAPFSVEELTFRLSWSGRHLRAIDGQKNSRQIRALHIHSKITTELSRPGILRLLILANRIPVRLPITAKKGLWASFVLDLLLGRSFRPLSSALSRALPSLFGRVLNESRVHTPNPLSLRQRRRLVELLPVLEMVVQRRGTLSSKSEPSSVGSVLDWAAYELTPQTHDELIDLVTKLWLSTHSVHFVRSLGLIGWGPLAKHHAKLASTILVSPQKCDTVWTPILSEWGSDIESSLCFHTDVQLINPIWFRDVFSGSLEACLNWLKEHQGEVSWEHVVHLYGGWVSHNRRRKLLLRRPSALASHDHRLSPCSPQ